MRVSRSEKHSADKSYCTRMVRIRRMTVGFVQGIDLRKSYLLTAEIVSTSAPPCLRMLHEAVVRTGKHKDTRASWFLLPHQPPCFVDFFSQFTSPR